jgi:glycosyltransferase involved in cell wall biosynthesis
MRIALDARYAFRPVRRGIGNYIHQLLRKFARQAPDAQWLLYVDAAADPETMSAFSAPQFQFRQSTVTHPALWEQVWFPRAVAADRPDLLHATSNVGPLFYRGPVIWSVMDVIEFRRTAFQRDAMSLRHRLSRIYRMNAMRAGARRANLVLTISNHARGDMVDALHLSPDRVRVTYLAPNPEIQQKPAPTAVAATRDRLGIPGRYVLALGALDARKNTTRTVEAFRQWATQAADPDMHLVVVGVEEPAHLGLEPEAVADSRIHLLRYVSDEDLAHLYHGAELFLYPSLYEGFGLPVLEAMSCGVPVICSRSTSVGEVAGDAARLVDETRVEAIVDALDEVLGSAPLRRSLSERGLARASAFTWDETARLTLQAYRDVLSVLHRTGP